MIREVNYATYSIDHHDNLRIVDHNEGFVQLTGFTETDILQRKLTLKDLIPDDCWDDYLDAVVRSSQSKDGAGYLEHPIQKKDGSSINVLCYGKKRSDTSDISDILVTDITNRIKLQDTDLGQAEKTRILLQKLSFLSENEEEFIVDYSCRTDVMEISVIRNGEAEVFRTFPNYLNSLSEIKTLPKEDLNDYVELFRNALILKQRGSFHFRSSLFTGKFSWYRVNYIPYTDPETREEHILGRIANIDEEVVKSQKIEQNAQRDYLTSLYNPVAVRRKIDEIALIASEKDVHALLILDLDNFREINEAFGHMQGDELLIMVGKILKNTFPSPQNILGRLGSDEFVIYVRESGSAEDLSNCCLQLCRQIRIPRQTGNKHYYVTASIGAVIQDNGPDSFDHLYQCADNALYHQKTTGKNGFTLYGTF